MVLPLLMLATGGRSPATVNWSSVEMKGCSSVKAKDRFRDWNLYHKGIVAAFAAFVFVVCVRAFLVYDGAFEIVDRRVLNTSASNIWPWVVENKKRADWQGEIIRVQGLSVAVGRKRLLYWKRGYKQWRAFETTTALVTERLFKSTQESDFDMRWFEVELVPGGACRTEVKLREVIQPTDYSERFWFFNVQEERERRLENSLDALERWVGVPAECKTKTDPATSP